VKAAKVDIFRLAGLWHLGHSAVCPDWLKGRICSNSESQAEQIYSYIGIYISPFYSVTRFTGGIKLAGFMAFS
jgi:hypothetical protein